MTKVFFAMMALVFAASVIGGCRAEGEIDDMAPISVPR